MSYSGLDGDSAARLIEASIALHRATVALEDMDSGGLAQSKRRETGIGRAQGACNVSSR